MLAQLLTRLASWFNLPRLNIEIETMKKMFVRAVKAIFISSIASSLLLLAACGNESTTGQVEVEVNVQPQVAAQTANEPPAANQRQQMTPEERAAAREAQMQASAAAAFPTAALLDPNAASLEQLSGLPGVSAETAQKIVDSRPYARPSDLHAAINAGLSEEDLHAVYHGVFVKVGLNSGANDDFLLVPTTMAPRRLAHEFEEYRPYDSLEQFSREMSKYVSEKEVAFLTRYVTLD